MSGTIVVGSDGSPGASRALQVAALEASLRDADLYVVCAWHVSAAVFGGEGLAAELDEPTVAAFRRDADEVVRKALAEVGRLQPSLRCHGAAVEGPPAEVLVRAARTAEMIVVGNRGRGGVASALLGSVSQDVVHRAPCPVLIVPAG